MSCDGNRAKFFAHVCAAGGGAAAAFGSPDAAQQVLEQIFDQSRAQAGTGDAAVQTLVAAQTRGLFAQMHKAGLKPPTHSATGLPKKSAQAGYAAVYQTLQAIKDGKPLPPLAASLAAPHGQQRTLRAQRFDDQTLRMRCGTCGQFTAASGSHVCPRTATPQTLQRSLVRRLGVPASAYPPAALATLLDEAREGDITMRHGMTGETVSVTLDALPLALASGFVPPAWQTTGAGLAMAALPGDRVVPVLDATGLATIVPPSTPVAAAAIASGASIAPGTPVVSLTSPLVVHSSPTIAAMTDVYGGTSYETGRFMGTEFRKDRGDRVVACGAVYTVGDRSNDPADWGSARHSGVAPEPPKKGGFAGIAVGRTLVGAVELLRTGSVVETRRGFIEVCDADGALVAVYDPSSRTAGDTDGTSNASSAQMAAVLAHYALYPSDPLEHAFATDIANLRAGTSTPLAASDGAYLAIKANLDMGLDLNLGGTMTAKNCPVCGKFQSSAGCLHCAGAAPAAAARAPGVSAVAPVVEAPAAAPVSVDAAALRTPAVPFTVEPQITVEVASPTVAVAAPQITVEAPQVTVESPTVAVAAPQVTVEAPQVTAQVTAQFDPDAFAAAAVRAAAGMAPAPVAAPVPPLGAAEGVARAPMTTGTDPELSAVLRQLADNQQASERRMLDLMERMANGFSAGSAPTSSPAVAPPAPVVSAQPREPLPIPGRAVTPEAERTEQERMLADIRLPAPDPNLSNVPPWAKGSQFQGVQIPVAPIDPEFEINSQVRGILTSMKALITAGQRAKKPQRAFYLYGPPGTGKNYLAQQLAASVRTVDADGTERQGLPYFEREVTKDDTVADLIGSTQIENGSTVVRLGPIGQALAAGGVVCLNEVVRNPKILTGFQSILQEGVIRIPSARGGVEEIPVHPASLIVMTANPGMEGDAQRPSGAPLSRMAPFKLDKATPKEQGDRCTAYFTPFPEELRPNPTEIKFAVDFVNRIGDACGKDIGGSLGKNTVAPGPRELNRFLLLGKTVGWTAATETMKVYCQQDTEDFGTEWRFIKSQFEIVYGEDGGAVGRAASGNAPARS